MAIQIFGTKKSKDTKKAVMFFKERRVNFQLVDLNEKGMSKGEIESVARACGGIDNLLDTDSKEYEKRNLKYMRYDTLDILQEFPLLLKTPIVRNGSKATIGYEPDTWKDWL